MNSNPAFSSCKRRAIIDIGTNSVKLLVGEITGSDVVPVDEQVIQTRLGSGLNNSTKVSADSLYKTADAVLKFIEISKKHNAQDIKIIGTQALRSAENYADLNKLIKFKSGLCIEIISGNMEAIYAFKGVVDFEKYNADKALIADVGGGSTELVLGDKNNIDFLVSIPIGAVKLLDIFNTPQNNTINSLDNCRCYIRNYFKEKLNPELHNQSKNNQNLLFYGTGGTIVIMGRIKLGINEYNRYILDGLKLDKNDVCSQLTSLWSMSIEERKQVNGLPPERADIIVFGIAIYEALMNIFGLNSIIVSTRGLRYGILKYGFPDS